MDSELLITTKIWQKETFELIDYLSDDLIKTKIKVNSSGVLTKKDKDITFTQGENLHASPSDLLTIKKDNTLGKYVINCGNWSKDLSKLIDQKGAYLVYRGLSLKELNKNFSYRYYKLSQGDIFKIGRVYFKVLDIHLKDDPSEIKSNSENTVKGTMIKSSSCNSIMVNGQEIIKGAFSKNQQKMQNNKLSFSRKQDINNNSVLTLKKIINNENESLNLTIKNKNQILPKISSTNELISIKNKSQKNNSKSKKIENIKKELILKKPHKNKIKNQPLCRICYGEDSTTENPLIFPCICKGSMKYIHYECLKNWLNSKIEEDMSIDDKDREIESISYNRKDISCELCKEKLPDYIKYKGQYYNICFYKPKFEEFIVLESVQVDKERTKFIHLISFDNKYTINMGRANECELSIAELSVSRYHCMIHKEDGELFLEDNSSKFGTLVLMQNNNLIMNDYIPLKVQINKTYIKISVKKPYSFSCCGNQSTFESKKYDYQVQNRKCFDVLSYFIFKDNDDNLDDEEDEEEVDINIRNDNTKELIDNDEKVESNTGKSNKENKSNKKSLNNSEIYNQGIIIPHSNRIRKINVKKGKNDNLELPELDKINIENFKDSISLISGKKDPMFISNFQQNKQTNILKINIDKTGSISNLNNINAPNPNAPFSMVIKDYIHKSKKNK